MRDYILDPQEEDNEERRKLREELRDDILKDIQVYPGANDTTDFEKAKNEYIATYYDQAGERHFSLPSDTCVKEIDFNDLLKEAEKRKESTKGDDLDDLVSLTAFQVFLKMNGVLELPDSNAEGKCKAFLDIFSLYVCASSSIGMPRNRQEHQLVTESRMETLEKQLLFLTPQQNEIIKSHTGDFKESWLLPMAGGSGTGKTIIVMEIAKRLKNEKERDEVLLVNLGGGELTKRFRAEFQGKCESPTRSTR
ncbi:unnamed protein product [Darwinula stevensoni]|uniref:Uncharacterized protein n=1 Tax=Darwinula stevensoni TaxID=69355 RepID=A0A7R9AFJ9_9CRUS|nr:unnamed protein product [Darwinula stevensoni]CAG0902725.1 unnamed protein product [Darwinula stevensoni]